MGGGSDANTPRRLILLAITPYRMLRRRYAINTPLRHTEGHCRYTLALRHADDMNTSRPTLRVGRRYVGYAAVESWLRGVAIRCHWLRHITIGDAAG